MRASRRARLRAGRAQFEGLKEQVQTITRELDHRFGCAHQLAVHLFVGQLLFLSRVVLAFGLVHVAIHRHQTNDVPARDLVAFALEPLDFQTQKILDVFAQHLFREILHRELGVQPREAPVHAERG